jgi:hypothetical protein
MLQYTQTRSLCNATKQIPQTSHEPIPQTSHEPAKGIARGAVPVQLTAPRGSPRASSHTAPRRAALDSFLSSFFLHDSAFLCFRWKGVVPLRWDAQALGGHGRVGHGRVDPRTAVRQVDDMRRPARAGPRGGAHGGRCGKPRIRWAPDTCNAGCQAARRDGFLVRPVLLDVD